MPRRPEMTLGPSNLEPSPALVRSWDELGVGAPTIIALAHLCSQALAWGQASTQDLSVEARAILYAARERGILEVVGTYKAFESAARLLTVYVEIDEDRRLRFRSRTDPYQSLRFLDAFRELCARGLVMHHLFHEFSLSRYGFEYARTIPRTEVESVLDLADECGPGAS